MYKLVIKLHSSTLKCRVQNINEIDMNYMLSLAVDMFPFFFVQPGQRLQPICEVQSLIVTQIQTLFISEWENSSGKLKTIFHLIPFLSSEIQYSK